MTTLDCPAQRQKSGLYSRTVEPASSPCDPVLSMFFQLLLLFLNKFCIV